MKTKAWNLKFFFLEIFHVFQDNMVPVYSHRGLRRGESCDGNKALSRSSRELGETPVYRVRPSPERYLNKFGGVHTIFTEIRRWWANG